MPPEAPAEHASPKPRFALDPDLLRNNVPETLRALPQWVAWRYLWRKGKWTKVPIDPKTGRAASTTEPRTWSTFDEAVAASTRFHCDGAGFVFVGGSGFVGIDVDCCCKSERILDQPTFDRIKALRTYGEWSPSGLGVHLICQGRKPGPLCRNGNVEIYDHARFFCMTGDRLPFALPTIDDCGEALVDFYRSVLGALATEPDGNGRAAAPVIDVTPDPTIEVPTDKLQVLIENDPKFKATWERQRPDLKDQSASSYDLSLASFATAAEWTDAEAAALIHAWREKHDENPRKALRPDYINRTIAKSRVTRSYTFGLTDLGNAERFVRDHGEDIRYCASFGRWYIWDGQCWRKDTTLVIYRKARVTVRNIYREAADCDDQAIREAIVKHAKASESEHRIKAMVSLARSDASVAVTPDCFDCDPFAFNVQNGTIDLRTGELHSHCRDDLITKLAPVDYDPDAECPMWLRFLDRILVGKRTLIGYLQRLCGIALTADIREQILTILWGGGANGKSTLVDTFCGLMGDYATVAPAELLTIRRNEEHPTEIADLFGRRLVIASESEEGKRLRCEFVKRCTGDTKLKARRMRQDYFEFTRTHSTWLITNSLPRVDDDNVAMWRRIKLVPFTVTIPEREQDKTLLSKLRGEWPGILAWAVRGCLQWLMHGLGDVTEIQSATAEYRREQDRIADFIAERCVLAPGARVSRAAVRAAYIDWCEKAGDKYPVSPVKFYEHLRRCGATDAEFTQGHRTVRGFDGLGLRG